MCHPLHRYKILNFLKLTVTVHWRYKSLKKDLKRGLAYLMLIQIVQLSEKNKK
jgi:hypothetical protein